MSAPINNNNNGINNNEQKEQEAKAAVGRAYLQGGDRQPVHGTYISDVNVLNPQQKGPHQTVFLV